MIERLLEPGSTELPACQCGCEMTLARLEAKADDTRLKIFECSACGREMRLMVWGATSETAESTGGQASSGAGTAVALSSSVLES
jgi:hypothetical protein